MSRAMYRYQVPVGLSVSIDLTGHPVSFGALPFGIGIEFWAEHDSDREPVAREFVIVGTGHPIPDGAVCVGTAPRTREGLVWHLYQLTGSPS